MTVILAFADLIFAKKCQHRYAHNKFCFRDFNFREWYQDSRNSRNLNPTKIMPYMVAHLHSWIVGVFAFRRPPVPTFDLTRFVVNIDTRSQTIIVMYKCITSLQLKLACTWHFTEDHNTVSVCIVIQHQSCYFWCMFKIRQLVSVACPRDQGIVICRQYWTQIVVVHRRSWYETQTPYSWGAG